MYIEGGNYFLEKNPLLVKLAKASVEKINSLKHIRDGDFGWSICFSLLIENPGHICYADETFNRSKR